MYQALYVLYSYLILIMVYEVNNVGFLSHFKLGLSKTFGDLPTVTQRIRRKGVRETWPVKPQARG